MAGRTDLNEKYLARMLAEGKHGADPIVRILAVVRYPRQHALYWPEVAVEVPPMEKGCMCRMHALAGRLRAPASGRLQNGMQSVSRGTCRAPASGRLQNGMQNVSRGTCRAPASGRLLGTPRRLRLYEKSRDWARRRALERCADPGQRDILLRHGEGVYMRRRQAVRFKKPELEKYINGY